MLIHTVVQGVAITQENSLLDNTARIEGWLSRFPMFDWVGGRTSEMSAVGLLAAALQVSVVYTSVFVFPYSTKKVIICRFEAKHSLISNSHFRELT